MAVVVGGSAMLVANNAFADQIVQTFTTTPSQTEVHDATSDEVFNYYGDYVVPTGAVLNSVVISFAASESVTSLGFTNSSGTTQNYDFSLTGNLRVDTGTTSNAIPTADLSALRTGTSGTIFGIGDSFDLQAIANGATNQYFPTDTTTLSPGVTLTNPSGVLNVSSGVTSSNPGAYAGTGTFDLSYITATTSSGQSTQNLQNAVPESVLSNGTYTVTYNYSIPSGVPEPTTMVLMGSVLMGLGLIRKRTKKA